MNMRVRQLWAPVLSTFLVSVSVQFVALRVPQSPPWVFFTRRRVRSNLILPIAASSDSRAATQAYPPPTDCRLTAVRAYRRNA